jgi:hypothetical protein
MNSYKAIGIAAALALICLPFIASAQEKNPHIVKVPCRDMGDGRILLDSLYFPDWATNDTRWDIIGKRPTSMKGEWANLVCTIRPRGR